MRVAAWIAAYVACWAAVGLAAVAAFGWMVASPHAGETGEFPVDVAFAVGVAALLFVGGLWVVVCAARDR